MSAQERILIIDDNEITCEIYRQMLIVEGYEVRTAMNVEAGLREAASETPAAVLLDLHLPLSGGLEYLHRLRAESRGAAIPVAIVTGDYFIEPELAGQLNALGARIHFKPIWQEDLLRIVRELISSAIPSGSEPLR